MRRAGYTLVPAIAVAAVMLILGVTFLGTVYTTQTKNTRHEEHTLTATAIAETGFHNTLAVLSQTSGRFKEDARFNNSSNGALQQVVRDAQGTIVGSYDAWIENGDLIGGKTVTGSSTAGRDSRGNPIWYNSVDKTYSPTYYTYRHGIKVNGYVADRSGNRRPVGRTVYAVVLLNTPPDSAKSPSPYLLFSEADLAFLSGTQWFGPLHSNRDILFRWYNPSNMNHPGPIAFLGPITYAGGDLSYRSYHTHWTGTTWAGTPKLEAHRHSTTAPSHAGLVDIAGAKLNDYTENVTRYSNASHEHVVGTSVLNNSNYFVWGSSSYQPQPVSTMPFPHLDLAKLEELTGGAAGDEASGRHTGTGDFRAYYFGKELSFTKGASAGQRILQAGELTRPIWVNENAASNDFMQVAATKIDSNYKTYTYREIPANGVILVKDQVVKIGNYLPKGSASTEYNLTGDAGTNTIVDGRLSIVSHATHNPSNAASQNATWGNPGDIAVVGNVIYRNRIITEDGLNLRQCDPGSNPGSVTDPSATWVTNTDGSLVTRLVDGEEQAVGRVCSLGLYASNDIRLMVKPYQQTPDQADAIEIHGQLVAGASSLADASKLTQANTNDQNQYHFAFRHQYPTPFAASSLDGITFYGAIASFNPPWLSYYASNRMFLLDKTLSQLALPGLPYLTPNDQIFTLLPQIVPGTWISGPIGTVGN